MTKEISLKKNAVLNAVLTMSSFIFPLITFPYVSRVLLPIGTGKVSFAISLILYFSLFSQLGVPTYGIRACAQVRNDREQLSKTAQELLRINLIMCAITYVAFFLAITFVPRLQGEKLLYIVVSSTMLFNAIGMEWLYQGLEQYKYITVRSLLFKALAIVFMFLLVRSQDDYVIYGALYFFAASASNILNFIHARKYISMRPISGLELRKHLRPIGVFFAMACASTIYVNLDVLMLGFMTTDADVGYYHAAVRVKQLLTAVVTSLGAVLLPRASYFVKKGDMEGFHRITGKALRFVVLFATPVSLYFILFAKQGLLFLSGNAFEPSIIPMQIIMPTVLIIGITNVLGIQVLVSLGREKVVLYSEIGGAITDLALNAILIPRFKSSGAAIGTLAAEIVVLIIQLYALRGEEIVNKLKKLPYGMILVGVLLATGASFWTWKLQLLSNQTWNRFVILAISAPIFFGVYAFYLWVRKEPLIKDIFSGVRKRTKNRKSFEQAE